MNLRRRALTLGAIAALSLALVPSPVLAAAVGACAPGAGGSDFLLGRNGVAREKDTGQVHKDLPARAKGAAPASLAATVPVWFHVITNGSLGNLTSQPDQRPDRRSERRRSAAAKVAITPDSRFPLAGVTRTDNAVWYASRSGGAEHDMKVALKRDDDGTLNVYTTSGGAYLGWAYLPEITDTAQAYLDGIVIDWRTVPGASSEYSGEFDEGDTLTHETGHWLNLEHTFYGQCNKSGDFVDDTPPQKSATSGCPEGKDSCPAAGPRPDPQLHGLFRRHCITQFTPGQSQRMRDAWLFYRAS